MTKKTEYHRTHVLAKVLVCLLSTGLIIFINGINGLTGALVIVNILYYFGVNTMAYIIENLLHLKHKHEKV